MPKMIKVNLLNSVDVTIRKTSGHAVVAVPFTTNPPEPFTNDWGVDYKLLRNVDRLINGGWFDIEAVPFMRYRDGNSKIAGDVLMRMAKERGANLGQGDGEMLYRIQAQLPIEVKGHHIPLTSALYKSRITGLLYFPTLVSNGQCWSRMELRLVISHWNGGRGRFLVARRKI